MRYSISALLGSVLVAAMMAAAGPASASASGGGVVVNLSAKPETVTLSRPALQTYAAYDVKITNTGYRSVNYVTFTAHTTVGGTEGATATFLNSSGLSCSTTNTEQTAISCAIGELSGSGGSVSFTLSFNAPAAGTSIALHSTTSFVPPSHDYDSARVSSTTTSYSSTSSVDKTVVTELSTFDPNHVVTYFPAGGGTVFTGTTGVASKTQPWTTVVTLPGTAPATTAELFVVTLNTSCLAGLTACFESTLTIPGQFDNLVIKLRRDGSTITRGTLIANAQIFYAHDDVNFGANPVPLCSSTLTGGPTPGNPCILSQKVYPKPGATTPGSVGGWEFIILARDNGSYRG